MKAAIIGAGPAGLALAYQLTKNNCEVDIYDHAQEVGGLSKSIKLWDRKIEIGPHFFNIGKSSAVKALVQDVLGKNYTTYQRKTFLLTAGKTFSYPPSVGNMLSKLSVFQLINAAVSLCRQRVVPEQLDGSAEAFIKQKLGTFFYHYFFINLCQKLWGLDGKQLSDVFAKSLIGFNQGFAPPAIICKKLKDGFNPGADKDLHIYPEGGFSTLWNSMKVRIEDQGGKFYLSTQIKCLSCAIRPDELTHLTLQNGEIKEYDCFISTVPISSLLGLIGSEKIVSPPEMAISYRSNLLLYLEVQYDAIVPGQCFYIYSKDNSITRVTNFNAFTTEENNSDIILLEFWCGKSDPLWEMGEDELLSMALAELEKTKIFNNLKILGSMFRKIENAFQVPDLEFPAKRENLLKQIAAYKNLFISGRSAAINFNYGMENALEEGLKLADELLSNSYNRYKMEVI